MVTADHVARAIVAACRETAEDPVVVASGQPGAFRSRHYAMWALLHVFQDMKPTVAAALVGAPYKPGAFYYNSRASALPSAGRPGGGNWWNAGTYQRVIEAIGSDEPLPAPEPPPYRPAPPPKPPLARAAKLGTSDTAKAVMDDDDDRPIFDRGSIGAKKQREHPVEGKRTLYDELRAAVANTVKMTPAKEESDEANEAS